MEGPSIHLLAEELQLLVGSTILKASGNAKFDKEVLLKQKIKEIYAFGKRLIIQLDHNALAAHFLMFGSYRIDEQREGMAPRLALITNTHSLFLYNCAVRCFALAQLKRKLDFSFDILSPEWDMKKIIKAVQKHPASTIDDVLLDQDIFAGVGNIIKNEALFMSKVKPTKKIADLSTKKLKDIALNTRLFSQKFLELRKQFELKKNLQIYRKKECPHCGSSVQRKKTGKRNRWSFFCSKCQK